MTDNAKPAFAGTCGAPCSARDRFTLDPESGFVYDRENEEWLTEPGSVFDAMWPLLPNKRMEHLGCGFSSFTGGAALAGAGGSTGSLPRRKAEGGAE